MRKKRAVSTQSTDFLSRFTHCAFSFIFESNVKQECANEEVSKYLSPMVMTLVETILYVWVECEVCCVDKKLKIRGGMNCWLKNAFMHWELLLRASSRWCV